MAASASELLTELLADLDSHLPGEPNSKHTEGDAGNARGATQDALVLYHVASRLVELQMYLVPRGDVTELKRELHLTREMLEGTRAALVSALVRIEAGTPGGPGEDVAGRPTLQVMDGGSAQRRRAHRVF